MCCVGRCNANAVWRLLCIKVWRYSRGSITVVVFKSTAHGSCLCSVENSTQIQIRSRLGTPGLGESTSDQHWSGSTLSCSKPYYRVDMHHPFLQEYILSILWDKAWIPTCQISLNPWESLCLGTGNSPSAWFLISLSDSRIFVGISGPSHFGVCVWTLTSWEKSK